MMTSSTDVTKGIAVIIIEFKTRQTLLQNVVTFLLQNAEKFDYKRWQLL